MYKYQIYEQRVYPFDDPYYDTPDHEGEMIYDSDTFFNIESLYHAIDEQGTYWDACSQWPMDFSCGWMTSTGEASPYTGIRTEYHLFVYTI